jgi:cephalosporin hydroxylase
VSAEFEKEVQDNIERQGQDVAFARLSRDWTIRSSELRYTYNFKWMGLPIIQLPQDIVAMQELIWSTQPDVLVETGVARGGSAVFYASLMELIGKGKVVSVELDLHDSNRSALDNHPMRKRIEILDGNAIANDTAARVQAHIRPGDTVLVCLDSNHTHDHVLRELQLYAPMVSVGSYLVVFDTVVEVLPEPKDKTRPWGKGNNPWTAVQEFLRTDDRFKILDEYDHKLAVSYAQNGYLQRLR